jgi:two-component system response regulator HydG
MRKKISILIVDDDVDLGDSLSDILDTMGFNTTVARSGKEALNIIKAKKFDAIIIDIRMPQMNGVETLHLIKKQFPLISVVMITAYAEDELIKQAEIDGALKVLSKPLDIDRLVKFLERLQSLKTLLIVDDNKEFCDTLKEYVDKFGYDVVTAHNVCKGIEQYNKHKSQFLVIDIKLREDNGLEIVNAIRERGAKSAIILMSGYAEEYQTLINSAINDKVDYFVEKPFEMYRIIEIIGEVTRKRLQEVLS